jgi:bacteriocin biosynthesis cyclodehydratase domain-containing protein
MNMGAMRRPRIKRTTEPIEAPGGDLLLMRPSGGEDVKIEQPDENDRRLLAAFDGEHTIDRLYEEFGESEVEQLIAQLRELELVEDGADDDLISAPELARFDRQLRYFSDIGNSRGPTPSECQKRLREAKVAFLGVGGLGGSAALWLACTGVGEMWLVDGDRVELSNLNRQILYTEADVGEVKVEVAAERLRAFNSAMHITTAHRRLESEADVAEFIAGADVVVDAADWPAHDIERWCNAACFEAGIPYITMSHFPPVARVGPFYVPGKTGCYVCQEMVYRREYPLFDIAIEQRRAQASPAATLGPACGMIGGQVGMEVMHLLTGLAEPSTLGVAQICDLRRMQVKREQVVPQPECQVCGHLQHDPRPSEEAGG